MAERTTRQLNELVTHTLDRHPDFTDAEIVANVLDVVDAPDWHPVLMLLAETEVLRQLDEKRLEVREDDH